MAKRQAGAEPKLGELRLKITDLVARNAIAMVQAAIDGALEEGQYQAIKYLFEMVGIYPASSSAADEPEESLSGILLKHLGVALQKEDESSRAGEAQIHPVE